MQHRSAWAVTVAPTLTVDEQAQQEQERLLKERAAEVAAERRLRVERMGRREEEGMREKFRRLDREKTQRPTGAVDDHI